MENKCLVCGAIIPEGRQVCPNCEKGGKHEISKKLTDEQIELETYLNSFEEGDNITVTCDLLNAMEQALDLIHRLQEHNGNEVRMRCDMQRKYDDLQTLCIEQKAEIERLKELNAGLALANLCDLPPNEDCLTDNEFEVARKTIDKQKAKIERLTEENEYLDGCAKQFLADYQKCVVEVAERQKDVERLTEERDKAKRDNTSLIYNISRVEKENDELRKQVEELKIYLASEKVCSKQAVKDTAKEIYSDIGDDDILVIRTEYGTIEVVPLERLQGIIKGKGVEAE